MPSKTGKQANFMRAVAHGFKPSGTKAPPVSVAKEFVAADKGKKFTKGERKTLMADMTDKEKRMLELIKLNVGGAMTAKKPDWVSTGPAPQPPSSTKLHRKGGKVKKYARGGMVKDSAAEERREPKMSAKAERREEGREYAKGKR